MLYSSLLAAIPHTEPWSFGTALAMGFCNLVAVAIGRYAIKSPGQGPDLPVSKPDLFRNFNIPELLATFSFGHILGAGLILGLTNAGVI